MSEISPEVVYWVTRLDHIQTLIGWLSAIAAITSIAAYIFAVVTRDCDDKIDELKYDIKNAVKAVYYKEGMERSFEELRKTAESINDLKKPIAKSLRIVMFAIIGFLVLFVGCAFIPSTKEACAILVIPSIANSEIVKQELPKSVESIVKIANRYLEDLATDSKKGGKE